jgi:hypothetical protein
MKATAPAAAPALAYHLPTMECDRRAAQLMDEIARISGDATVGTRLAVSIQALARQAFAEGADRADVLEALAGGLGSVMAIVDVEDFERVFRVIHSAAAHYYGRGRAALVQVGRGRA